MLRFSAFLLLSLVATFVSAIKFDLDAHPSSSAFANRKCLSQYVGVNTMVIVTVKVGEGYNQRVDLEVGPFHCISNTIEWRESMDVSTDWSKSLRYMTIARASTSMQPDEMLANKAHDSLSTLMLMHLSSFALQTLFLKVGWSAGQIDHNVKT